MSIKKAILNQYLARLAVTFLAPTYRIIFFFSPKIALRWPAPDTVDRVDNLDTRLMVGQLTYWASQLGPGLAAQTINATPQKTSLKAWLKYLRQDQMLANPKCNPVAVVQREKLENVPLGFNSSSGKGSIIAKTLKAVDFTPFLYNSAARLYWPQLPPITS